MMSAVTKERVLKALEQVMDPEVNRSIVDLNMVRKVEVRDSAVDVEVALTVKSCPLAKSIEDDVRQTVLTIPGIQHVNVTLGTMSPEELKGFLGMNKARHPQAGTEHVKHLIVVGAGKGGVGKSTIAVNLALAFQILNRKVGLFDADLYGPSTAKMLGITDQPVGLTENLIEPIEAHDLKVMTFGTILRENQPVIWRGPMLHKAIEQFLLDTLWGELDFLVMDLPPGTGDVAISTSQLAKIDGAVLVTTPQEVAVLDVRKALSMFRSLSIPILGVVENMSYFRCGKCGEVHHLFGKGGAEKLSALERVPVLGQVPLEHALMEAEDRGVPFMLNAGPESEAFQSILGIARRIDEKFSNA